MIKVLLVLCLMVMAYAVGKFTGFIRGQAATIAFYETVMKELAKTVLKEYEDEESSVRSDYQR